MRLQTFPRKCVGCPYVSLERWKRVSAIELYGTELLKKLNQPKSWLAKYFLVHIEENALLRAKQINCRGDWLPFGSTYFIVWAFSDGVA